MNGYVVHSSTSNFTWNAEHGPFWLKLTGPKGTKDFIRADGAALIKQ